MKQAGLKMVVCSLWLVGAYVLRDHPWARRFFAYGGVVIASFYWGPLGFASLQQALALPNARSAEVPLIGYFVGLILGPLAALLLGHYAVRSIWLYLLSQALTVAFVLWVRLGTPEAK